MGYGKPLKRTNIPVCHIASFRVYNNLPSRVKGSSAARAHCQALVVHHWLTVDLIDSFRCSWLVKYEDNDEEDLEWPELKPLLAQAAAAAKAAGGAKKAAVPRPRTATKGAAPGAFSTSKACGSGTAQERA